MDEYYRGLINSDRVSTATRGALERRLQLDLPDYVSVALDNVSFSTLRALLDSVIPQRGLARVDLAARLDQQLADNDRDGWRYAELPTDIEAYRTGLRTLNEWAERTAGNAFPGLSPQSRKAVLDRLATDAAPAEFVSLAADHFSHSQMQLWFEDVRADAVKIFVGLPMTLASIGYSGIANGGDGQPKSGFSRVGLDEREAWEPLPATVGTL